MALLQVELSGGVNVGAEVIRQNIASNIRRALPQIRPCNLQATRICLVGGGPSLDSTLPELRQQVFEGAKVVAVNGSAQWLIERNIRPSMHVLLDARAFNARFLEPSVPGCRYLLASQCAPETFDAAAGRDVTMWHSVSEEDEDLLRDWYGEKYVSVGGGTTVMLRAVVLLRLLGFTRIDCYGLDSCWMGARHHGYEQPENDRDARKTIYIVPRDPKTGEQRFDLKQGFDCDPWHCKQAEDFQLLLKSMGNSFSIAVHGNGLIASMVKLGASLMQSEGVAA